MAIERVVPDELDPGAKLLREHVERYELAASLIAGGDVVVDAACGSGYGSAMLAERCARVIGLDISAEAIAYAGRRYARGNLLFSVQDLARGPVPECDVLVSFETVEHLPRFEPFLEGAKNNVRGQIILSTPVIPTRHFNPFHLQDFTREQIEEYMRPWVPAYCCIQSGIFGVWVFRREPARGEEQCRLLELNLRHQQFQSARFEKEQEEAVQEWKSWAGELEKGKAWLEEQWHNFQELAAERQCAITELHARVAQLEQEAARAEARAVEAEARAAAARRSLWGRLARRFKRVFPDGPVRR
jgi:SAM-dependent methyltransferase